MEKNMENDKETKEIHIYIYMCIYIYLYICRGIFMMRAKLPFST